GVSDKTFRGHLFTAGEFNLNDMWRTGFDVNLSSDKTYLRRYNIPHDDILQSKLYLEGFENRSYVSVNNYYFQGLRAFDQRENTPRILPEIQYDYVSDPG